MPHAGNSWARATDWNHVECSSVREALSAVMDGEAPGTDAASLQAHLDHCADCLRWRDAAARLDRMVRISPVAQPEPDLSERVLDQVRLPARRRRWHYPLRAALLLVALVQLAVGVANLVLPLGLHAGMLPSMHMSHEVAAFNVAFAALLMITAMRPSHARAHVPILAVFLLVLVSVSVFDLVDGAVSWTRLATHAPILVGLLLATALARTTHPPSSPGTDADRSGQPGHAGAGTDPGTELPHSNNWPRRGTPPPPPAAQYDTHRRSA